MKFSEKLALFHISSSMTSLRNNTSLQEGSFLFYPSVNFPTPHLPLNSYNVSQKTANLLVRMHNPVFLNLLLYQPITQGHVFETLKQKLHFRIQAVEQSFHNSNFAS